MESDEECAVAIGGIFLAAHEGDGGRPAFSLDQVDSLDGGAGHGRVVCPSLWRVELRLVWPPPEQVADEDIVNIVVAQVEPEVAPIELQVVPAGRCGPDVDDGLDLVLLQELEELPGGVVRVADGHDGVDVGGHVLLLPGELARIITAAPKSPSPAPRPNARERRRRSAW